MAIPKKIRKQVYDKCGGHCAYCGKEIAYKDMQVDHVVPLRRGDSDRAINFYGLTRGTDDIDNLLPACRACNFRKGTFSLEQFRQQIKEQCDTLCRTFQARMSLAYGLIERIDKPIVFYFEKLKMNNMETKEINIAEILKDCPKGIKLYSPILGSVAFDRITETAVIVVAGCSEYRFRWNGKYHITNAGECMLFPSKEQRDWSNFTNPSKPPFEIYQCKENETFYFINEDLKVTSARQYNIPLTGSISFKSGNYFNNKYQAEYAAEKVKELLLSMRKDVE